MVKEEIAHYEQFLLFPRCFQKAYLPGASKGVIVWEWVNTFHSLPDYKILEWSKLKTIADYISAVTDMMVIVCNSHFFQMQSLTRWPQWLCNAPLANT